MNVEINVESYSTNDFDPVAAVIVATLGLPSGNNIKTATFYDNDLAAARTSRFRS